jgi:serine/threonine protein kinase
MTRLKLTSNHGYDKASNKQLLEKVNEVVSCEVKRSTFFDSTKESIIPRFTVKEIIQGNVVGQGGFCVVRELYEIKFAIKQQQQPNINSCNDNDDCSSSSRSSNDSNNDRSARTIRMDSNVESSNSREYLAHRIWHQNQGQQQEQCQYVVKQVNPNLLETNKVLFLKGTIDLALETKYLASLCHPHIVTLRGLCKKSASKGISYFVILDNLPELLTHRLNTWIHRQYRATKGITGFLIRSRRSWKVTSSSFEIERLLVAYNIADAMHYLHLKNIIYRDLKPDNIGFDIDGILKLFDFGLAKELVNTERTEDGLYNMTGMTGGMFSDR